MTFNGVANQYTDHPLAADPGDTVRFYVVDAGPSLATDLHVVGWILDRVYLDSTTTNVPRAFPQNRVEPHVTGTIRIGCSGWVYPSWRGVLYPAGLGQSRWLARYAELFDTVEVNSTFYRLASPPAVERWVQATPPGFRFTVKASRYLTHITQLQRFERSVGRFYAGIAPLVESGKLEAVLWQFPPTQKRDDALLERALPHLPTGRHAFEFRHPSWFVEEVLERLRAHDVALVIGDHPERPWQPIVVTASFSLVRLHYGARGRRGNYSERELRVWASRLRELAADVDVDVYLNNDWEGFAVRNAIYMKDLLSRTA